MNALLNYPGAKWGMAEEIISLEVVCRENWTY